MKILMYTVQNADLPVIYIVMITVMCVKYAIRRSVQRTL